MQVSQHINFLNIYLHIYHHKFWNKFNNHKVYSKSKTTTQTALKIQIIIKVSIHLPANVIIKTSMNTAYHFLQSWRLFLTMTFDLISR